MGFFNSLLGIDQARAARNAAADTYAKQTAASNFLKDAGNNYQTGVSATYSPFYSTGLQSNDAISRLLSNPESIRSMPGYQFNFDEGLKALDRSAAARTGPGGHGLGSGAYQKDLLKFGQGIADNTYGSTLDRLARLTSGIGGVGAGGIATGYAGKLGADQAAANQMYGSSGTIGQGDVAAAQAQSDALGNLLRMATYLGGAAIGGGAPSPGRFFSPSGYGGGSPSFNFG